MIDLPPASDATRWQIIVNPASGRARQGSVRVRVECALAAANVDSQFAVSSCASHAEELVIGAVAAGLRRFAVAGGDGTAHAVLNGLSAQRIVPLDQLTLALLPLGTGNDWARTLAIPRKLDAAVNLLAKANTRAHDVGVVTCQREGRPSTRHFLNVAGAGFDAHVVRRLQSRRAGRWTYYAGVMQGARTYRAASLRIRAGDLAYDGPILVAFANIGRYLGGGMRIARNARYDDGLFDVTIVRAMPGVQIIAHLPRLLAGDLARSPWVATSRTTQLEIEGDAEVEADGELLGCLPATVRMAPSRINVVTAP